MRRVLVPAISLGLVVGIVVLILMTMSETPPEDGANSTTLQTSTTLAFGPFELDNARFQKGIDEQIAAMKGAPEDPNRDAILNDMVMAYERIAIAHAAQSNSIEVGHAFTNHARLVHDQYGIGGLSLAGEMAYARFLAAFSGEPPPAPPKSSTYREGPAAQMASAMVNDAIQSGLLRVAYPGDFRTLAQTEGFVDARGQPRSEALPIIHLLFRYRWMRAAQESLMLPVETLLTPYEVVRLRRWQVEISKAPLEAKPRILDKMRSRIMGYDVDEAEAILHMKAGNTAAARQALSRGLEQARANDNKARIERLSRLLETVPGP